MQSFDRRLAGILFAAAALALQCDVRLDHDFDDEHLAPGPAPAEAPPLAPGCLLFGASGLGSLAGDGRSLDEGALGSLWFFDQATRAGDPKATDVALRLRAGPAGGASAFDLACAGEGAPEPDAVDLSLLRPPGPPAPDRIVQPLDSVATPAGVYLYYALARRDPSVPLGQRPLGYGVARAVPSPDAGVAGDAFTSGTSLLWGPDAPGYGASAVVVNGDVYVYGCASTGPLRSRCRVARAPLGSLEDAASYSYFAGGAWTTDASRALDLVDAGASVSVRYSTARRAYLMTYVPVLGSTLVLRTASAPEGPWSSPVDLATCDVSSGPSGSFCSGAVQHPELGYDGDHLALSYGVAAFQADLSAPLLAFWPHLTLVALPP